ncbi:penicillin-binding transpeptidase domain-containing protein [Paractinoplanes atraurantiacus]|uniref:Cell division protein FtsI/penicillin-binding protein 2 n=1 Tax=Paractinoplanes atraurantiacus TaxID=1036182 RepID=A0A285KAZ6_9ACTN|nr:penicillin-binding transpeptidase domain-containing protein [Actinoplanes atraurantiacus]SNY69770.1 Cell division protein FtsI/penicillin-binding protein 2 [Actinoplanes atraurantiacus]
MRLDRTARRGVTALVALVLLGAGVAACGSGGAAGALDDFLTAWKGRDLTKAVFADTAGKPIEAATVNAELTKAAGDLPLGALRMIRTGVVTETGDDAEGAITMDWTLPGGVPWSYDSSVRLTRRGNDGWRVIWEPAVLHKDLGAGDKLALRRVPAARGRIVGAGNTPLVAPRAVVTVTADPARFTETAKLVAVFKKIGVDVGAPVEPVTLRGADFSKIEKELRKLPGLTFSKSTRELAPTRMFARALLGTVDEATADDLAANPGTLARGDQAGHGGLQERYDTRLRGTAALAVEIEHAGGGEPVRLHQTEPVAGVPVRTTIDVRAQTAADAATATEKRPSSLVAVRISDSSVLAVSNGPDGDGDNVALTGQVPPGSTFKMVSALGLLQKKAVTANSVVACPKAKEAGGQVFANAHDMALGDVPFHVDFAQSCNTAFVNLAPKLGADGLHAAAAAVGLGADWDLGVKAFSGQASPAGDPAELAQAAFGQGQTAVSPIAMAAATAAVARGRFVQPKLVLDPAPAEPAADGAALAPDAAGALRTMMREVVTSGTGKALKNVKGKPVYGKTGSAEFDNASPQTHAWFVGWQGDIAFAVLVQNGGAGAETAVPIVHRFLSELSK